MRGSIVPQTAPRLIPIAVASVIAVLLSQRFPTTFAHQSVAPFTLIGLTLSVFISFRNNACYDRWWEGRKLWGQLIADARSLGRELAAIFPDDAGYPLRRRVTRRTVGFIEALGARLRGLDGLAAAKPWLEAAEAEAMGGKRNLPDALLAANLADIGGALGASRSADMRFQILAARTAALGLAQTGCERILTTPLPFAYSLLLHRTAWIFCLVLPFGLAGVMGWWTPGVAVVVAYTVFGLDVLGDELEEPFGLGQNDLPVNAMVRQIEVDLLEQLGETDLPPLLEPKGFLLQ